MNISGDSNVAKVGSMNYAYDWGTATTCNGVAFTSQTVYSGTIGHIVLSGLDSGAEGPVRNAFGGGGMSAAYTDVIEGGAYGDNSVRMATLNSRSSVSISSPVLGERHVDHGGGRLSHHECRGRDPNPEIQHLQR